MKPTHEQLLAGEVYTTSIIFEPLTASTNDGAPLQAEQGTAKARALLRWFSERQADERDR
jgi:hypothetical protein